MGFIGIFIFLILIQYILSYIFQMLGLNYIVSEALIDLFLAVIFAIIYYRGDKKEAIKDPLFHRSIAIYFLILILFSLLYYLII